MTAIILGAYESTIDGVWDEFVCTANEGTLFHRLDFLRYHGSRFAGQEHHVVWRKGQALFGVMPMAIFQEGGRRSARSPYGASYGGPVFQEPLDYAQSAEVVRSLLQYLAELNVVDCTLTLPISCCYEKYSDTFRFALLENGFLCVNRDVSNAVFLPGSTPVDALMNKNARWSARKAGKLGIRTAHRGSVSDFLTVLEKTFAKHGVKPTHTASEFAWLCEHLSEDVYVDLAYRDAVPVAGIGFFKMNKRVNSSFYLCQDPEFEDSQASSLLIRVALSWCQECAFSWFDFGTSSACMRARSNLFAFKESFGAVGLFRETYRWEAP